MHSAHMCHSGIKAALIDAQVNTQSSRSGADSHFERASEFTTTTAVTADLNSHHYVSKLPNYFVTPDMAYTYAHTTANSIFYQILLFRPSGFRVAYFNP